MEEAGRLGDEPGPGEQDDRDAAHGDETVPPQGVVEVLGDQPAQEDARGDEHAGQAGQQSALFGGHELLDVGHRGDVEAPDPEADAGAQDGQQDPAVGGGEGGGGREDHQDDDAPDEGGLAAEPVGQAAPGDGAQDGAQAGASYFFA